MTIALIAAAATDNALGKDLELLWHLPNDFKHFKQTTTGHTIIMGRKTYESLPKGALPNRTNIVLSSQSKENFPGCLVFNTIDQALEACKGQSTVFIIGGEQIYNLCIPRAHKIYLTRVKANFPQANKHFPTIHPTIWKETSRTKCTADEKHPYDYDFITYERT